MVGRGGRRGRPDSVRRRSPSAGRRSPAVPAMVVKSWRMRFTSGRVSSAWRRPSCRSPSEPITHSPSALMPRDASAHCGPQDACSRAVAPQRRPAVAPAVPGIAGAPGGAGRRAGRPAGSRRQPLRSRLGDKGGGTPRRRPRLPAGCPASVSPRCRPQQLGSLLLAGSLAPSASPAAAARSASWSRTPARTTIGACAARRSGPSAVATAAAATCAGSVSRRGRQRPTRANPRPSGGRSRAKESGRSAGPAHLGLVPGARRRRPGPPRGRRGRAAGHSCRPGHQRAARRGPAR